MEKENHTKDKDSTPNGHPLKEPRLFTGPDFRGEYRTTRSGLKIKAGGKPSDRPLVFTDDLLHSPFTPEGTDRYREVCEAWMEILWFHFGERDAYIRDNRLNIPFSPRLALQPLRQWSNDPRNWKGTTRGLSATSVSSFSGGRTSKNLDANRGHEPRKGPRFDFQQLARTVHGYS